MAENNNIHLPNNIEAIDIDNHNMILPEIVEASEILPGKVITHHDTRMALHQFMTEAGRPTGAIRFSENNGVIYITFPEDNKTLLLREISPIGLGPDYIKKGKKIEFTESARKKIEYYLRKQQLYSRTQASLEGLSQKLPSIA